MKKMLTMFGAAGLLGALLIFSGCGDDNDTTAAATTTTTAAATTTTAAATTTTAAATTTTTAAATTTTTVATTTTTTVATAIAVSTTGTDNAATANKTYTIAAGSSYTYTISGFGTGDKLVFPAGNTPTVNNISFTDGIVDVQYALNGNTVTVKLTGFTNAQDITLNFISDFNTVFGAGTIQ
jgi:hypothetical protein